MVAMSSQEEVDTTSFERSTYVPTYVHPVLLYCSSSSTMYAWLALLSDWCTSILWFLGWPLQLLRCTAMLSNFTAFVNRSLMVSFILASACALVLMNLSSRSAERPYKSLEAFIDYQEKETKVRSLAELPVEALKIFSDVTCLQV